MLDIYWFILENTRGRRAGPVPEQAVFNSLLGGTWMSRQIAQTEQASDLAKLAKPRFCRLGVEKVMDDFFNNLSDEGVVHVSAARR
ncbi:MAG: hypothetical protein KJ621_12710 [Proteobacteria bacterium]|nr:hypothetical protein [Pseudomonadota bacterium]